MTNQKKEKQRNDYANIEVKYSDEPAMEKVENPTAVPQENKVGKFIVIWSAHQQNQRYNLEKIRTYGKSDDMVVTLVWDSGLSTQLKYGSKEEADKVIEMIDGHCL